MPGSMGMRRVAVLLGARLSGWPAVSSRALSAVPNVCRRTPLSLPRARAVRALSQRARLNLDGDADHVLVTRALRHLNRLPWIAHEILRAEQLEAATCHRRVQSARQHLVARLADRNHVAGRFLRQFQAQCAGSVGVRCDPVDGDIGPGDPPARRLLSPRR
jgi:hypothetical protein